MQTLHVSRPSARPCGQKTTLLSQWHPLLSADCSFTRTKASMESIRTARIAAETRLALAQPDPAQKIGSVFQKHNGALRAAITICLGSFLSECDRLIEDLNAL